MPRDSRPRRRAAAEATRRRLLRAGRRAFARRGLAGANLRDDILAPAGVSVGSFYHQFEDKTELLLAILREQREIVRRRLELLRSAKPPRSFAQLAERAFCLFLELAEASPDVWRIQARERWSHDRRVRRLLRAERRRQLDWLCEEQARLAGRRESRVDRAQLAEYLLGLAGARADTRLALPRHARLEPELGLVRFATGGARALARPPVARRRQRGSRARAGGG